MLLPPLSRSLLLSLCIIAPATAAPQKSPLKKPLARKPSTKLITNARVLKELKRVAAAYEKLGSYTLSSRDSMKMPNFNLHCEAVGSIGKDGRRSIRARMFLNNEKSSAFELFKLYDGSQIRYLSTNQLRKTEKKQRFNAAQLKKNPSLLKRFFESSPGLALATALRDENFGLTPQAGTAFSFRELGQGRSEIRVRYSEKVSAQKNAPTQKNAVNDVSILLVVGRDGFLQRVEGKEGLRGAKGLSYYTNSFLSRPHAVDPKMAFNWGNLLSPPPQIIGQMDTVPVLPQKDAMPTPLPQ
jgi:hypothetical protein